MKHFTTHLFTLLLATLMAGLQGVSGAPSEIELSNGSRVQGQVLLERDGKLFVDLGYTLLEIPKDAIHLRHDLTRENGDAVSDPQFETSGELYRIGESRRERSLRDNVTSLGEAVTLVQTPTGLGSGFVINPEGYVVTNDHVIAGENRISVTVFERTDRELNKLTFDNVRIVASSSEMDLALLKIEDTERRFKTVALGGGGDLREGQSVFAIGSPLGLDRTVSEGIISLTNRVIDGRIYLQTTTQISPGNSGGPLLNLRGEVVGVNNMKVVAMGAEGLGFSISAITLRNFLDNLDAFAFDPRNPNAGFRYNSPPRPEAAGAPSASASP